MIQNVTQGEFVYIEEGLVEFIYPENDASIWVPARCGIDVWLRDSRYYVLASPFNRKALKVNVGELEREIPPGLVLVITISGKTIITTLGDTEILRGLGDGAPRHIVSPGEF